MSISARFAICWLLVIIAFELACSGSVEDKERHEKAGRELLSQGKFADALLHLNEAVDLDSKDYQLLYLRATALLATGKSKLALPDLDEVVQLKPDFTAARIQRGNVLLKQCDLERAQRDYDEALKVDSKNADVRAKLKNVADTRENVHNAKLLTESKDLDSAEYYLTKALEFCVWDASLYRMRADCFKERGEMRKALVDLRTVGKLQPDSTETFLIAAKLSYDIGDVEESLGQIRECLKLNPDHKECFPFYKRVKKLAKMRESLVEFTNAEKWSECLEKGRLIHEFESKVPDIELHLLRHTCKCNLNLGRMKEALSDCSKVVDANSNDVEALCERAEVYVGDDDLDNALDDLRKAQSIDENAKCASDAIERVEKMKKAAGKRDYYKILGVRRNAKKREIMKAYRKQAQKWHPDNFSDDKEKKKAEAKFIDIAAAKEVLTDVEKRAMFDAGRDPLDTSQQEPHHAHPFHFQGFPDSSFFQFHFR